MTRNQEAKETSSQLAKYGSYTMDAADEEKEEIDSSGGGADFLKLKVGRNTIRVLPPSLDRKTPFRVVYQHYVELPGKEHPAVFVCPRLELKEFCPCCDIATKLRQSGNKSDEKRGKNLMPKRRVFTNAIKREEEEKGVQVFAFGKLIHEDLVGIRRDPSAGGDFSHPMKGFDIVIERVGTGKFDTEYTCNASRVDTPLIALENGTTQADIIALLETMHDLEQFAKVLEEDAIIAKMNGDEDAGEGGDSRTHNALPTGQGRGESTGRSEPNGSGSGRGESSGRGRGGGRGTPIDTTGEDATSENDKGDNW